MKIDPIPAAEPVSAEDLRRVVESAPFQMVMARVRAERERMVNGCVYVEDKVELFRVQGAAQVLETVLLMPERIIQELIAKSNKPAPNGRMNK